MSATVDEREYSLPEPAVSKASWKFSLGTLLVLVVVLSLGVLEVKAPLPMMMVIGFALTIGFACLRGVPFETVQRDAFTMMRRGLPPLMIFVAVGAVIAAWSYSGTTAVLVYYGVQLLSPSFFLPATFLACALASLINGSSFGTLGTLGVALMGVAAATGVNIGAAAGAAICGALFGDKMSPLSETTVMAPGLVGVNLFRHIRHMLWTTGPAAVISLIIFTAISLTSSKVSDGSVTQQLQHNLSDNFNVGWPTFIPPLVVAVLLACKWDAFPTLMVGAGLGVVVAVFYQHAGLGDVLTATWSGYKPANEAVAAVLAPGDTGVLTMLGLGSIILFALGIAGCLASCGVLQSVLGFAERRLTTPRRLVPATLLLTLFISLFSGVINFAVAMTTTLLRPIYQDMKVDAVNLSRAVEDAGTMFAPLIPWGVNAIFITKTLDVSVAQYAPYAFICFICISISMLLGITGWTVHRTTTERDTPAAVAA